MKEGREELHTGMRATPGAGQNTETRTGIGTCKEQVPHDRELHAGTRSTTDTVRFIVYGKGAGRCRFCTAVVKGMIGNKKGAKCRIQVDRGAMTGRRRSTPGSGKHNDTHRRTQELP